MFVILKKIIWREWQQVLDNFSYWALLFIIPPMSILSIVAVISVGNVNDVPMIVVDNDQSNASRDLIYKLDASAAIKLISVTNNSIEALAMVESQQGFGYLIIPESYQKNLMQSVPVEIIAMVNQQNFMLGNILSNQVFKNILQSSLSETARHFVIAGATKAQATAKVQPLDQSRSTWGNSFLNYHNFLLAGLLSHIWHVLVTVVTVVALGREFKQCTVNQWYQVSEKQLGLALVGKLAISAFMMAIWLLIIYLVLFYLIGLHDVNLLLTMFFAGLVTQFLYQCIGVFIVSLTGNYRLSLSAAAFYTTPAFAFVGISFPTFNMDWAAQFWNALLPVVNLFSIQDDLLHWNKGFMDIWSRLSVMTGLAMMCLVIIGMLLPSKIENSAYWGKH